MVLRNDSFRRTPHVYHSTDFGPEILETGQIAANSTIRPNSHTQKAGDLRFDSAEPGIRGVCVTRSFHFARLFSPCIFALDLRKIRYRFRMLPRAEQDAYDLANDHGDYRIEAEEFIVCPGLSLDHFLLGIWLLDEYRLKNDYQPLISHCLFKGYFHPA